MAASIFFDKAIIPHDSMVAEALASTYSLWEELRSFVHESYPDISGEWKYYSKSAGWTFPVKSKKRTLYYFIPKDGYFSISFVFGDKAVAAAESAELPHEIIEAILSATPYMEGRSFAVDVDSPDMLENIKKLLKIKYEN
jgi:hypothetical protein